MSATATRRCRCRSRRRLRILGGCAKKKATRANPKILKRAAHTISEIKTIVREAIAVAVGVTVAVGIAVGVGVRVPSRNMALSGKALNQMSLALGLSGLRSCAS